MISELTAGINTLGEQSRHQADRPRFGGQDVLRRDRARRIHAAARLSAARRVSWRVCGDARYVETAAGGGERPGIRRRRGIGGARRPRDRDSQGEIRAAGNQARRVSAAGRGDAALHSRAEAGAGACADRRDDYRGARARNRAGELAGARRGIGKESCRT